MIFRSFLRLGPLLVLPACGSAVVSPDDGTGGLGSGGASTGGVGPSTGAVGPATGGAGPAACTNVRPTGTMWDEATCDQWASETTECGESWMADGDYCNESCGRCSSGSGGGASGGTGPISVTKFVGNITTGDQVNPQGLEFATYWDQITPENAGKWGSVQPFLGGGYNWGTLDAIHDYAESRGILFKQHAFVWGSQQPQGGVPSEGQVRDWIASFCQRYPNTKLIDVVNEPPPHTEPNYADNIGGGTDGNWQWITNSFIWARESCPGAILILNDYNNIEWSGDNQHFIDIVNTVLENGGPVDAVGAQAHDLDHENVTTETMKQLLAKLHEDTGLDVFITEYDISTTDDAQQLQKYQEHIPYFMATEYVKGLTLWGWIYGSTWNQAPNSGLIRNGSPRPAMTWLMDTLGRPVP